MKDYSDQSIFLLRISLATLIGYFGLNAILSPQKQAGIWMASWVQELLPVEVSIFMILLGVLQTVVAVALLLGFYPRIAALAMALLLVGIIINLGISITAGRNAVILTAALAVAARKNHIYAIRVARA